MELTYNEREFEAALVHFGNYLLKHYGVMEHSSSGEPICLRKVSDADLSNWKETVDPCVIA